MELTPDIVMMLRALFPDYVDVQFMPPHTEAVKQATFDPEKLLGYLREQKPGDELLPASTIYEEHIQLEEIGDGVWAGMAKKTHTVFVVVEKGEYG